MFVVDPSEVPFPGTGSLLQSRTLLPDLPRILVPPDVGGSRADTNDVEASIAVDVRDIKTRGCHVPFVQRNPLPSVLYDVNAVIEIEALAFAAIARDNFVLFIPVNVGAHQSVPFIERRIDHKPLPGSIGIGTSPIDHDLVAVPRLDSGQKTLSLRPDSANADLAGAAFCRIELFA